MKDFQAGLEILDVDLGEYQEILWHASQLPGKRSLVARRVVESVSGLDFDRRLNEQLGFAENVSHKNLRKKTGKGKFKYIRRGRLWVAAGTARHDLTVDVREQTISDLWGYQIRYNKKEQKVKISISARNTENFKAQILGITDSRLSAAAKLKIMSDYYRNYYDRHRFTNDTHWYGLDSWVLRRARNLRRALGTAEWKIFLAHVQRSGKPTYLPRRSNFFWDAERELNCEYRLIWNPHRF